MQKSNPKTPTNPKGAGRKKGVKIGKIKPETIAYYRRVTPEEYKKLDEFLEDLRIKFRDDRI